MGELSAILPWTHESIQQTRQGLPLLKFHYRFLYAKVQSRCIQAPEGTVRRPLREKGKILDLWNLFYMAGILLLILFDLWLGCSYAKLAFGILLLFFSYQLCVSALAQIVGYTILSIVVVLVKNTFFCSLYITREQINVHG